MMIFKYCNLLIPLFLLISGCDSGFEHDIVIRNGTIIDGTGHSRIQGDIALNGNLITVIGLVNGAGKKEIDAKGKIVAPGFIDTEMTQSLAEEQKKTLINQVPLGRLGEVSDIANTVLFLSSDLSKYITGSTIHVNGGMLME